MLNEWPQVKYQKIQYGCVFRIWKIKDPFRIENIQNALCYVFCWYVANPKVDADTGFRKHNLNDPQLFRTAGSIQNVKRKKTKQ